MLAFISHLIGHSDKALGTAVHIGAGVGRELELYKTMQFQRVVAVESDPTLFNKLSRKSKSHNQVQTKNAWIAAQSGDTSIHCFANPRFNSLLAPDQLETHFANLKQCEQKTAKATGINELIAELSPLDSKQSHLLVLDVQGAEAVLLEACSQESLAQFEWVVVRTSQESLYKNSVTANNLSKTLATRDFMLRFSDDENAPFIEHYYQRDQNAVIARQTESKLNESQQKNTELNARCEEIVQASEQTQKDFDGLMKKLEEQSEVNVTKDTALKEKAAQVEQFEQQVISLSKQLEEKTKQAEEESKQTQEEKQALAVQLDAQKQAVQAQQEKTEQAEQAKKKLQEHNQALDEQLDAQKQAVQAQQEKAKQAEEENKQTQEEKQALAVQLDAQKQAVQAQQEKTEQAEEATKQLQQQKQALVDQLDAQKQAVQAQQEITKQAEESNKQLQQQNQALVEQLDAQKQAVQAQQEKTKQAEEATKQLQEQKQALSEQLDAQKQAVQAQQEITKQAEEASKQLQQQKQALGEQLDAQKQAVQAQQEKTKQAEEAIKQLQEQKQALGEQLDAQKQAAIESTQSKEANVNELKSELAATKKQLEQQTQWHHQNKDRVESLNKQISELKQQILERQKASDMAIKLQTKAQVDLDDLRNKYQAKNHNEKQLVELVKELRVKLKQAAEFYHYLENNHPELAELDYTETKDELVKTKKSAKKS